MNPTSEQQSTVSPRDDEQKRVLRGCGKYADSPVSVEDFERECHEENEREQRKYDAWLESAQKNEMVQKRLQELSCDEIDSDPATEVTPEYWDNKLPLLTKRLKSASVQTILIFLFFVLIGVKSQAQNNAEAKPISFAQIGANQEIRVDFTTQGCFHYRQNNLVYTNHQGGLFIIPNKLSHKTSIYKLKISNKQAAQLDHLLSFYRRPQKLSCTTVDSIKITLVEDGKKIAEETYKDATGLTSIPLAELEAIEDPAIAKEDIDALRDILTFHRILNMEQEGPFNGR